MMTVSAAARLMPRPPARELSKNKKVSGSELNDSICRAIGQDEVRYVICVKKGEEGGGRGKEG